MRDYFGVFLSGQSLSTSALEMHDPGSPLQVSRVYQVAELLIRIHRLDLLLHFISALGSCELSYGMILVLFARCLESEYQAR